MGWDKKRDADMSLHLFSIRVIILFDLRSSSFATRQYSNKFGIALAAQLLYFLEVSILNIIVGVALCLLTALETSACVRIGTRLTGTSLLVHLS